MSIIYVPRCSNFLAFEMRCIENDDGYNKTEQNKYPRKGGQYKMKIPHVCW